MGNKVDYEGRILRSVLLFPDRHLEWLVTNLNSTDFQDQTYQRVYKDLQEYSQQKSNGVYTNMELSEFLYEKGTPADVVLSSTPNQNYTDDDLKRASKQVRNRTKLNKLTGIYKQALANVERVGTDADKHSIEVMDAVWEVQTRESQIDNNTKFDLEALNKYRKSTSENVLGVPTGIETLDFNTYGMVPQRLWLLGGYTSVGKSWLGIRFMAQFIKKKSPVLFISTEMSATQVQARVLTSYINDPEITVDKYLRGTLNLDQNTKVETALKEIAERPVFIVDSAFKLSDILHLIRYHQVSYGVQGVFIDYVQNIYVDDFKGEYQTLNDVSRTLQQEANTRGLFICLFSQVNRASLSEDSQAMGFRGSGNLEAAADVAMTVKKHDDFKKRILNMQKNRHGSIEDIELDIDFSYGGIDESRVE